MTWVHESEPDLVAYGLTVRTDNRNTRCLPVLRRHPGTPAAECLAARLAQCPRKRASTPSPCIGRGKPTGRRWRKVPGCSGIAFASDRRRDTTCHRRSGRRTRGTRGLPSIRLQTRLDWVRTLARLRQCRCLAAPSGLRIRSPRPPPAALPRPRLASFPERSAFCRADRIQAATRTIRHASPYCQPR